MTCQTNLVKLRCCNASAITNVEHSVDISTAYKYFSNMLLLFLSILLLFYYYYKLCITTKPYQPNIIFLRYDSTVNIATKFRPMSNRTSGWCGTNVACGWFAAIYVFVGEHNVRHMLFTYLSLYLPLCVTHVNRECFYIINIVCRHLYTYTNVVYNCCCFYSISLLYTV